MKPKLLPWLLATALLLVWPAPGWAGTGWDAGPGAQPVDVAFTDGAIDSPTASSTLPIDRPLQVTGWVVDTTAEGWAGFDAVHVYLGKADQGGRFLAAGTVGQDRPDVAQALGNPFWAAAGFDALVPVGLLGPGPATLTVYAHAPDKGWWSNQVDVTIAGSATGPILQVETPAPAAELKTSKDDYPIAGFALDPAATRGSGVNRVEVYIYAERGRERSQLVGQANLGVPSDVAAARYGTQFASAGWSMTIKPTRYRTGNTLLYVYARSSVTGQETLATVDINIVEQ